MRWSRGGLLALTSLLVLAVCVPAAALPELEAGGSTLRLPVLSGEAAEDDDEQASIDERETPTEEQGTAVANDDREALADATTEQEESSPEVGSHTSSAAAVNDDILGLEVTPYIDTALGLADVGQSLGAAVLDLTDELAADAVQTGLATGDPAFAVVRDAADDVTGISEEIVHAVDEASGGTLGTGLALAGALAELGIELSDEAQILSSELASEGLGLSLGIADNYLGTAEALSDTAADLAGDALDLVDELLLGVPGVALDLTWQTADPAANALAALQIRDPSDPNSHSLVNEDVSRVAHRMLLEANSVLLMRLGGVTGEMTSAFVSDLLDGAPAANTTFERSFTDHIRSLRLWTPEEVGQADLHPAPVGSERVVADINETPVVMDRMELDTGSAVHVRNLSESSDWENIIFAVDDGSSELLVDGEPVHAMDGTEVDPACLQSCERNAEDAGSVAEFCLSRTAYANPWCWGAYAGAAYLSMQCESMCTVVVDSGVNNQHVECHPSDHWRHWCVPHGNVSDNVDASGGRILDEVSSIATWQREDGTSIFTSHTLFSGPRAPDREFQDPIYGRDIRLWHFDDTRLWSEGQSGLDLECAERVRLWSVARFTNGTSFSSESPWTLLVSPRQRMGLSDNWEFGTEFCQPISFGG